MDLKEFRVEILKTEIESISTKINHFDDLRLRTRQTCISLWIAALGVALTQNISAIYFLAVFIPIPFWIIEARYRRYQKGNSLRLGAIRNFIRDEKYNVPNEKEEATLDNYLNSNTKPIFPAFYYWGNKTIPNERFKKEIRFINNLLSRNIIIIYFTLIILALFLEIFRNSFLK